MRNRQNITELFESHVIHISAGHILWDWKRFDLSHNRCETMISMYEKPLILARAGLTNIQNCTICFICRWVLFMFLLVLYFRVLDDIVKPASLCSSISL